MMGKVYLLVNVGNSNLIYQYLCISSARDIALQSHWLYSIEQGR